MLDDGQREGQIWLEAKNPNLNVARRYAISRSQDLFGVTIVEFSWGRIGTRGQQRKLSFADAGRATKFVEQLLHRRASSQNRIGVCYREVFRGP
ncbi:MAG: WGR domain-containing protein [Alphaproteobacteria bacterium]|nr:WGR domain-containing protein [Alphaproteobacteria bacterium]